MGIFELIRKKRGRRTGTPLAATYTDEVTAMLYGTKRLELEHRDSMSMMREENAQGAPPDLDNGVVRLRRDGWLPLRPEFHGRSRCSPAMGIASRSL